jgi:hypothetical protein
MRGRRRGGIGVLAASLIGACGAPPAARQSLPADCSLWSVEDDLFAERCNDSICHAAERPAAGLDLVTPGIHERIVGARSATCGFEVLVEPGDESGGYFVDKLTDRPGCGLQMPIGGAHLTGGEIECVRAWVVEGADGS